MSEELGEEGRTISLPDGRQLGYLIVGEGNPVLHFHGGLSSRLEVLVFEEIARSKNLQIVGVDRPGFGLSTYAPKRRIRDFSTDVSILTDHLGIEKFMVTGYSTGGPYAITFAALHPKRVIRSIVISGLSLPLDTSELPRIDKILYTTTPIIGTWIQKRQRNTFLEIVKDPDAYLKSQAGRKMLKDFPKDLARVLSSPSRNRDIFLRSVKEVYRQGSDSIKALIQERKLMKDEWDVDLSKIPKGLVHIWHGTADKNAPISNAYKNAEAIPGAHLEIFEHEGHTLIFNNLRKLGEILSSRKDG
jgi:pimeloyl-ACP methyl ester carboxylesterase